MSLHTKQPDACQKLFMPSGDLSKTLHRYEYRPAQMKMAQAVRDALAKDQTLLVEAATGTGKTWAYLIPAILSQKKIIVATGTKTLQDQLFFKDLPFLKKTLPSHFTFCMMKGKSNYLCLHRFYQSLQQTALTGFDRSSELEMIQEWAMTTKSGDRAELINLPETSPVWQEVSVKGEACLGGKCPEYSRCYLTRLKQEAAAADLVVVNHHLFFADLALKNNGYGEILPHYQAIIFDEAHLLEEIATQFFGVSLSNHRVEDFARDAEREFRYGRKIDAACFDQTAHLLRYSSRFFQYFRKGTERYRLRRCDFSKVVLSAGFELVQCFNRLDRLIQTQLLKSDGIKHLSDRIESLLNDLSIFLEKEKKDDTLIYWVEQTRRTVFLHTAPLDVSAILQERLFKNEAPIILTSATLSAQGCFDFIKERLGIDAAEEIILKTAFDYEKQVLFYLPTHLPSPSEPGFSSEISDEIVRILEKSKGRAFLLFTSWKNLEAVYQNVSNRLPYRLLKQGEHPKQVLIQTFREDTASILFGTSSFWQGVDVEGEALSCVIIDKLPFASPADPLTAARIEALSKNGKDPFLLFQIPVAILSLRQGIGRLIRNSKDRGLITILDHRITKKSYGKYFLSSLPAAPKTNNFSEIAAFLKYL